MKRRTLLSAGAFVVPTAVVLSMTPMALAEQHNSATLYKNPECSCCDEYAKYLRRNGYTVKVVATHDLAAVRRQHSVPEALEGCHTLVIGGYAVEGRVPYTHIDRLLVEKPTMKGISLPGMPQGSPGMTGRKSEPFTIYEIRSGERKVYATD